LNPGPPALEDSNIPLGYRGGGIKANVCFCIVDLLSSLQMLFLFVIIIR